MSGKVRTWIELAASPAAGLITAYELASPGEMLIPIAAIVIGVWLPVSYWAFTANPLQWLLGWKRSRNLFFCLGTSLAGIICVQVAREIQLRRGLAHVQVTFTDSPLLTDSRKRFIRDHINLYSAYLKANGFQPPMDRIPPLGVAIANSGGQMILTEGVPYYENQIRIRREGLASPVDVAYSYGLFAFYEMFDVQLTNDRDTFGAWVFSEYFLSAYIGRLRMDLDGNGDFQRALRVMWRIRDEFGPQFADNLISNAATHYFSSDRNLTTRSRTGAAIRSAVFAVDNDRTRIGAVGSILVEEGF
jgi:hypothetical protein